MQRKTVFYSGTLGPYRSCVAEQLRDRTGACIGLASSNAAGTMDSHANVTLVLLSHACLPHISGQLVHCQSDQVIVYLRLHVAVFNAGGLCSCGVPQRRTLGVRAAMEAQPNGLALVASKCLGK